MMVTEISYDNIDVKRNATATTEVILHQEEEQQHNNSHFSERNFNYEKDKRLYDANDHQVNEECQNNENISNGKAVVGYAKTKTTSISTPRTTSFGLSHHPSPVKHHHQLNQRRRFHRRGLSADRGK